MISYVVRFPQVQARENPFGQKEKKERELKKEREKKDKGMFMCLDHMLVVFLFFVLFVLSFDSLVVRCRKRHFFSYFLSFSTDECDDNPSGVRSSSSVSLDIYIYILSCGNQMCNQKDWIFDVDE